MKRLKWWERILINSGIAFGFAFFSCLAGLQIGGYGFDWITALATASIMGGLSFFTTLKAYFYPTEPKSGNGRMSREFKSSSKSISRSPLVEQKEEETDQECSGETPRKKVKWTWRRAIECFDRPLMYV